VETSSANREKNIHSMEPTCSLPLSQQPTTCLSSQPDKSNPRLAIRFSKFHFTLAHLQLGFYFKGFLIKCAVRTTHSFINNRKYLQFRKMKFYFLGRRGL